MQTLVIDPPLPFLLPGLTHVTIALVGCGGTGSHLAQALARLAAHCRDSGGPDLTLAFIDGDIVEAKNVGRQLFSVADIGRNKAQVLAARFSALFGLEIVAFPYMLDTQRIQDETGYGVLVGAVDAAPGRRAISGHLGRANWRLWLDCGNHDLSGQVAVGNTHAAAGLQGALQNGLCSRLPAPSLIYPELLKDAPLRPRADCAAAMVDNAQSLMINAMMAAVAGQYLYQIVVQRRLTTFCTTIDLQTPTMRSLPITAAVIGQAIGLDPRKLTHSKSTKKKARKAA